MGQLNRQGRLVKRKPLCVAFLRLFCGSFSGAALCACCINQAAAAGWRVTVSCRLCGCLSSSHINLGTDHANNGRRHVNRAWLCTEVTLFCNCQFLSGRLSLIIREKNEVIKLSLMNTISDYCEANKQQTDVAVCVYLIWIRPRSPVNCKMSATKLFFVLLRQLRLCVCGIHLRSLSLLYFVSNTSSPFCLPWTCLLPPNVLIITYMLTVLWVAIVAISLRWIWSKSMFVTQITTFSFWVRWSHRNPTTDLLLWASPSLAECVWRAAPGSVQELTAKWAAALVTRWMHRGWIQILRRALG